MGLDLRRGVGEEDLPAWARPEKTSAAALARDYACARERFQQALDLKPDDPRVRYNLDRLQRLRPRHS